MSAILLTCLFKCTVMSDEQNMEACWRSVGSLRSRIVLVYSQRLDTCPQLTHTSEYFIEADVVVFLPSIVLFKN